eukprot:TRINITY_DN38908_c0_g1_i2.p3 TRINITY_DN38908_c0_g1~~TRINITY_DN38908_c0_g1_i2.p3  ORF type:complete len:136 (-),score=12.91 TRINITY_DN38908_c0_g1_i2:180-587(-)
MREKLHRPAALHFFDEFDLKRQICRDRLPLPQSHILLHGPFLVVEIDLSDLLNVVDLERDLNPNPSADPGRIRLFGGGGDGGRRVGFEGDVAGDGGRGVGTSREDRTDGIEGKRERWVLDRPIRRAEERRRRCCG